MIRHQFSKDCMKMGGKKLYIIQDNPRYISQWWIQGVCCNPVAMKKLGSQISIGTIVNRCPVEIMLSGTLNKAVNK